MYLGYNTNGFSNHDPFEAIELIAELGYRAIAITVDHRWLNPFAVDFEAQLEKFHRLTRLYRLNTVIETGARYLLNPNVKHEPTLLSEGAENRQRRVDFLKRCIDIADYLDSDCVSLWSGSQPDTINLQTAMDRLAAGLEPVLSYAENSGVTIGFEPEPGMLIDTMGAYERLLQWIDHPSFQLTLDLGHLFCQGELPLVDFIERWQNKIVNIHIEDMNQGVHEHLMFGDGQIYFPPVMECLRNIGYDRGVFVELSRHSHDAPRIAKRSFKFLNPMMPHSNSRSNRTAPNFHPGSISEDTNNG